MSRKTHIRYRLYGIDITQTPKSGFNYSIYMNPFVKPVIGRSFTSFDDAKKAAEKKIDSFIVEEK